MDRQRREDHRAPRRGRVAEGRALVVQPRDPERWKWPGNASEENHTLDAGGGSDGATGRLALDPRPCPIVYRAAVCGQRSMRVHARKVDARAPETAAYAATGQSPLAEHTGTNSSYLCNSRTSRLPLLYANFYLGSSLMRLTFSDAESQKATSDRGLLPASPLLHYSRSIRPGG